MEFVVLERSEHPDHRSSPYSDCLFTARLRVVEPTGKGGSRVVMGAIPAFLGRKLQPGASLRLGDHLRARGVPFAEAPEAFRRMQTADRFGDYLLDYLLLTEVELLGTQPLPKTAESSIAPIAPIPQERFIRPHASGVMAERRKKRIANEINRIQDLLQSNGGSWEVWMQRLQPAHDRLDSLGRAAQFAMKKDRWFFSRLAFRGYRELCEDDPHTGPVGALRLLNAELHRRGIDLLVVPFPTKEDVNAYKFLDNAAGPDVELNPQRLRFHLRLLEHNIEVLDLTPALRAAIAEHEYVFFDNRDVHPADGGIQVAGREIARVLRDYGLGVEPAQQPPLKADWMVITQNVSGFALGARYPATQVLFPAPSPVPVELRRRVIFQGDSFLSVPSTFVPNATIADHTGRYLGFRPETVLREAGANLVLQDLARTPRERLEGRQVLVFVFGPTRLRSPRSELSRPDYQWHLALLPE